MAGSSRAFDEKVDEDLHTSDYSRKTSHTSITSRDRVTPGHSVSSDGSPVSDRVEMAPPANPLSSDAGSKASFDMKEIQRLVMESMPPDVRDMISPESWQDIFSEASASVLSEELLSLEDSITNEDINDLVSFISVYVQRRVKGSHARKNSDISEMTEDAGSTYRQEERGRTPMDAVALRVTDRPVVVENDTPPRPTKPTQVAPVVERAVPSSNVSQSSSSASTKRFGPLPPSQRPEYYTSNSRRGNQLAVVNPPRGLAPKDIRKLSFNRVEIRYYEPVLSDNPAVTSGPPIGIGWKYRILRKDMTIDAWEHRQTPNRRYLTELVLPRQERTEILMDAGYSQKQIADAVRDVLRAKNKRKQTYNNLRFQTFEEALERTRRRLKKALKLGSTSKHEKELMRLTRAQAA